MMSDVEAFPSTVVLLHGITRTSKVMSKMADALSQDGYVVVNLDYPSTSMSAEAIAHWVYSKIKPYCNVDQPIHFVGHSMGAIIIRLILRDCRPSNLGRVVMLAPPNHGSIAADFMQRFRFYLRWFGPAGQQLGTKENGIHHRLPDADYDCGIIAGNRSTDPWFSWFLYRVPNDGKVSVESTRLAGMSAHIVLPIAHAFLPKNKQVIQLTRRFLKIGSF